MERHKIETFTGFAVKARKILMGAMAVESGLRKAKVLLLCKTAQKNSLRLAESFARKQDIPIVKFTQKPLSEVVGKENCKLCAITDSALAQAILSYTDKDYPLIQIQRQSEERDEIIH